MKLQDRYNRTNLITTSIILCIAGVVYFYVISAILNNQIDKDLVVEENEIFDYVKQNHHLPQVFRSPDQQIYFREAGHQPVIRRFINTQFNDPKDRNDRENGRKLISSVIVTGKAWEIIVIESTVETEDLIQIIFIVMLFLILLLVAALFIANRLTIKKLWQPFYKTLQEIRRFTLSGQNDFRTQPGDIDEFNELNTALSSMALRVNGDYQELKGFMGNASHELMTPLAVMSSKLDTLLQTENFNLRQSELLDDIYKMTAKLTRINKAMLLLTKIENRLINRPEQLNLQELAEDAVVQFQDFVAAKAIQVETDFSLKIVTMDRSLFEVLINNLISNAIRHNQLGGVIRIQLTGHYLLIANTGRTAALQEEQIFERFKKSGDSEGIGLGLTLTRQICENYGFCLRYNYIAPFHQFTIDFCD